MDKVLKNIRSGDFNKKLNLEYRSDLQSLKSLIRKIIKYFYKTLISINKVLK